MNTELVSIIVPVYNAETYIQECIESVIKQTYQNWELLLIDDGSSDDSVKICSSFCDNDRRIYLYVKENSGVSETRNFGLDIAKGEFVIFLDSDDYWIDDNILLTLVSSSIKFGVDVIRGEYQEVDASGHFLRFSRKLNARHKYTGLILNESSFLEKIMLQEYFSVLCLFRKHTIDHLRFNVNRVFLEDAEFYLRLFMSPLKCLYITNCFYAYRKHSMSVSVRYVPNKFRDAVNFTSLCLRLSNAIENKNHQLIYIKEGVRNFIYDTFVIAESSMSFCEIRHALIEYNMKKIKRQILRNVFEFGLLEFILFALTPLFVTIYSRRVLILLKRRLRIVFNIKG